MNELNGVVSYSNRWWIFRRINSNSFCCIKYTEKQIWSNNTLKIKLKDVRFF